MFTAMVIVALIIVAGFGFYFSGSLMTEASIINDCPNIAKISGATYRFVNDPKYNIPLRTHVPYAYVKAYVADCNGSAPGGGQITINVKSNWDGNYVLNVPIGSTAVTWTIIATKNIDKQCTLYGRQYVKVWSNQTSDGSVEMIPRGAGCK